MLRKLDNFVEGLIPDVETYMRVFGLWYANTAGAIKRARQLEDRFIMEWTSYEICNILYLNK